MVLPGSYVGCGEMMLEDDVIVCWHVGNRRSPKGARALGELLRHLTYLIHLNLSCM